MTYRIFQIVRTKVIIPVVATWKYKCLILNVIDIQSNINFAPCDTQFIYHMINMDTPRAPKCYLLAGLSGNETSDIKNDGYGLSLELDPLELDQMKLNALYIDHLDWTSLNPFNSGPSGTG